MGSGGIGRDLDDSDAEQSRSDTSVLIIQCKRGIELQLCLPAIPEELPIRDLPRAVEEEVDALMCRQILGRARCAALQQILRARTTHEFHRSDSTRDKARIRRLTHAQNAVHALLHEIDHPKAESQLQLQIGIS